jgi:CMP-N,N'-diacetyllegionaminic acid synthase
MRPSVLAVIPARAHSKRIPGKNRKDFLGKPLICWSIDSALEARCISDVAVTTDDDLILDYAQKYPKVNFVKRPDELALDSTPGVDPILHLMQQIEKSGKKYDYLILLQPTSPLRKKEHIEAAFTALLKSQKSQLVSVKKLVDPMGHIVFQKGEGIQFLKTNVNVLPPDQELKVLNGAIYISEWQSLSEQKTFLGKSLEMFEMDEKVSVDIDYPEDWKRAESYARMEVL